MLYYLKKNKPIIKLLFTIFIISFGLNSYCLAENGLATIDVKAFNEFYLNRFKKLSIEKDTAKYNYITYRLSNEELFKIVPHARDDGEAKRIILYELLKRNSDISHVYTSESGCVIGYRNKKQYESMLLCD